MVCACLKKCVYLLAFIFLVTRVVDFSASEFDPLRPQCSFDHIAQHELYTQYVQPVHDKVVPVVTTLQDDYFVPTVTKVQDACLTNYQTYLSKYVVLITEKVSESPIYAIWEEHKPKLVQFTDEITTQISALKVSATKYTAIGLIKLQLYIKYAVAEANVLSRGLIAKCCVFYNDFKPKAIAFYNDEVVPSTIIFAKNVRIGWDQGCATGKEYAITGYNWLKSFYFTKFQPFLEENIFSHVRVYYNQYAKVYYNQYAKEYVDLAFFHVAKYYQILKVGQALDLSKKLMVGSYDQAAKYFQKESIQETETDATVAEEGDVSTQTSYDSMGTPEAPVTDEVEVEEEETVTETQTQETRATMAVVDQDMVTDNKELEKRAENDVELSLAQEIQTWKTYIFESVDNIFNNFDSSIKETEGIMVTDVRPSITQALRALSETAHRDYAAVNKAIYNINSTTVTLENGQEVEVDQTGNVIDHKVTREEMRTILAENSGKLKESANAINDMLRAFVADVEVAVDDEKKLIVDIYEEFAEVAINEFSKKMMYSTFSSSFDNFQNKKDGESFNDWKEYVKVKNTLITKREDLINKKPQLGGVNLLLAEVRETLKALDHETGSYYAILRAQANLAFQAREKEERLEEEAAQNPDSEEDAENVEVETFTIKTTIVRTETLNEDGTVKTDEAEIEIIEEEVISDVESDTEDYDIPEEVEQADKVTVVDSPEAKTVELEFPEETTESEEEGIVEHVEESEEEEAEVEETSNEEEIGDVVEHHDDVDEEEEK